MSNTNSPGPELRARVMGVTSLELYTMSQKRIRSELSRIAHMAESWSADKPGLDVLDFGCGSARNTTALQELFCGDFGKYLGVDIDQEQVAWCRSLNRHRARFEVCGEMPPLLYGAASFDAVVAVSVLSHMPEKYQTSWLTEFDRLLRPGGFICLSLFGRSAAQFVVPHLREAYYREGYLEVDDGGGPSFPAWYKLILHSEQYVQENFVVGDLRLMKYLESSMLWTQDVVLLRKTDRLKGTG